MNNSQLGFNLNLPISVSELTRRIKDVLETGFYDVWVQGEITGLKTPSSGHLYFSLKDKDAQIKAVFFRSGSRFLKFKPEDGLEVTLRGRLSVYEPRGEYQIIAEYMEPKGLGALQLVFMQLKEKLQKEGLFETARKRPLPPYPTRVGVVTSTSGAAIRDILKVLKRRAPGVHVLIAPATVQGDTAPSEVARAISALNSVGGLDVIIVARGGGSIEDLAAFNTETVARAIYNSKIPVISAVGHEVDFTISDFVADHRAPTPSAAAEIVATNEERLKEALSNFIGRLGMGMQQALRLRRGRLDSERRALVSPMKAIQEGLLRVDDHAGRLTASQRRLLARRLERVRQASRSLGHLSPDRKISAYKGTLAALDRRLAMGISSSVLSARQRLERSGSRLMFLEPLAPLKKGFAVVRRLPELMLIKDAAQVRAGDALRLTMQGGELDCKVEKKLP
jgi:exodeoxyribonuclease VII large subunit